MRVACLVLLVCAAGASWVDDAALRQRATERVKVVPKAVTVNLDLDPQERWAFIAQDPLFKDYKTNLDNYVYQFVPSWLLPVVSDIASLLKSKFYPDYAEEMIGLAKALDVSVGDIVLVNLIYQLENIGVSCDQRNNTGPCPSDAANGPGLCTAALVDNGEQVWQGRNLDWNLDESLLQYVMRVDYQRANRTVFSAVQIAGMVGVMHGLRYGGFSIQINARDQGGNVVSNLFEEILRSGAKTPSHVTRRALELSDDFADFAAAEKFLSTERLANPVYFVMAGKADKEGVILSRKRESLVDAWHLYEKPSKDTEKLNLQPDWLRVQTNYDHWEAVPDYDDRRTPAVANVQKMCSSTVDETTMLEVMSAWPTFNHHTDVTSTMCPQTGHFDAYVWMTPKAVLV